jgi:hypothetical protein
MSLGEWFPMFQKTEVPSFSGSSSSVCGLLKPLQMKALRSYNSRDDIALHHVGLDPVITKNPAYIPMFIFSAF